MSEKAQTKASHLLLRRNVNLLGTLLGNTIKADKGEHFFNKIEKIRQLSKAARDGDNNDEQTSLLALLNDLADDELVPVARSFSHFLNLTNIAEQLHSVSKPCAERFDVPDHLDELLRHLKEQGFTAEKIAETVSGMSVEVVLTAHPTEVTRRTLIQKYEQIFQCLEQLGASDMSQSQQNRWENRLQQLISQSWHTFEFRSERPTPVDEAKGGFATIEHSLWEAVPSFVRAVDERLKEHTGLRLPADIVPVRFSSWMGGDRDGNPFVTASVTREVLLLSRWMAADLYLRDLKPLIGELSMSVCNDALKDEVGVCREPYRVVLKKLRERLRQTKQYCAQKQVNPSAHGVLKDAQELLKPLQLCYDSLHECGLGVIADGPLLDTLRRARCFGLTLVKLDIRQESGRHEDVLSELTKALGLGDYGHWDESQRQTFLLNELQSPRPLLPNNWEPSPMYRRSLKPVKLLLKKVRGHLDPM